MQKVCRNLLKIIFITLNYALKNAHMSYSFNGIQTLLQSWSKEYSSVAIQFLSMIIGAYKSSWVTLGCNNGDIRYILVDYSKAAHNDYLLSTSKLNTKPKSSWYWIPITLLSYSALHRTFFKPGLCTCCHFHHKVTS